MVFAVAAADAVADADADAVAAVPSTHAPSVDSP